MLVLRNLTKTMVASAGLRVELRARLARRVLARLTVQRAHWPLGTLQLAIAACCPRLGRRAAADAVRLTAAREMVTD